MLKRSHQTGLWSAVAILTALGAVETAQAQSTLDKQLIQEGPAALAKAARELGDAKRGAIVFHQAHMACTKCHTTNGKGASLGPDLAKWAEKVKPEHLIESVLAPSKVIRQGFEPVTVVDGKGRSRTGLLVKEQPDSLVFRDVAQNGKTVTLAKKDLEQWNVGKTSIMPAGQVNQLGTRQQFLDLAAYLIEIAEHGPRRALELKPPAALLAAPPLPEYEQRIDHAGMIAGLDRGSFDRGRAIYQRLCINCHGTHDRPGSLPTSLRFAEGKFKNGSDPYSMYQTITRGFGMMVPQTWMVPQQKYDVIHYIREAYLKQHNASQHFAVSDAYLGRLPKGDTRGPAPSNVQPWVTMDYGPSLVNTYEIGSGGLNFAYKGIAVRLDHGPGGVSRGGHWMVFDHDTMRVAAAWNGKGFIDFNGIHFNGRHAIHPRVAGAVQFANTGPGWANPADGTFKDPRIRGRDGKAYGPLPRTWAHYKGMYYHGQRVIISYTVGETTILEMPELVRGAGFQSASPSKPAAVPIYLRRFNIGPRKKDMLLQVARHPKGNVPLMALPESQVAILGNASAEPSGTPQPKALEFNGATRLEVAKPKDFDLTGRDFTITARIRTKKGGTIFAKTHPGDKWVPDGKALFIRGGRLCFDIGWVGVVQSRGRVNDGKWHDVAMTWEQKTGTVQFIIDGKPDGRGRLKPEKKADGHVVRIGLAGPDFPKPSFFTGDIAEVRFYQRKLSGKEAAAVDAASEKDKALVGRWKLDEANDKVKDLTGGGHLATAQQGTAKNAQPQGLLLAGLSASIKGSQWQSTEQGDLRLKIPAGEQPLRFALWVTSADDAKQAKSMASELHIEEPELNLTSFTQGGPPRWPEKLKTKAVIGKDDGPFAVDVLTRPAENPWLCRVRLTGFDFYPDGRRMIVSAWDGDVWLVSGVDRPEDGLTWQRIASGLFQPLGVKIVGEKIYVTCRDQLVVLHDLNGDGETDFYENFNNDHQVTEHFHEFAMGLQTDAAGNFYYAKSARHALPALVPHHGTLLRVAKDGSRTDILATGFRAANGVCLNPDGTFFVTDQEGHWTPKNRINWVKPGGFYGNMYGYHDVKDTANSAMEQPLCWITNAFDRSPAELLWVDSDAWGPLKGSLLNLSYGYGKVYVVPHEKVNGQVQGGMCALPIPQFPTGVMRGRFHPTNGQLYCCGMFAWAGNQQQPGGFYRIRYTGKPVHLPVGLKAKPQGVELKFSAALDKASAANIENYSIKAWDLRRAANYGSKHYNERTLRITAARVSDDGRTVFLQLPDIKPTWCMSIAYELKSREKTSVEGLIHNTIHHLGGE